MLVRYGYYCRPTNIRKLVGPLIAMLNGRTDVPYQSENVQLCHCNYIITLQIDCSEEWVAVFRVCVSLLNIKSVLLL